MPYALRDGVYYQRVHGRPIILDTSHDRYLAPGTRAATAIETIVAKGTVADECDAAFLKLLAVGLVVESSELRSASLPNVCTATTSYTHAASRPSLRDILTSVVEISRVELALRKRPLASIVQGIAIRKPRGELNHDIIRRILSGYEAASTLVSRTDKCLSRSIALTNILHRKGQATTLVIGVMTLPFAAHCWVQIGTTVLNDEIDRIRCFTPILVV